MTKEDNLHLSTNSHAQQAVPKRGGVLEGGQHYCEWGIPEMLGHVQIKSNQGPASTFPHHSLGWANLQTRQSKGLRRSVGRGI